MTIGFTKPYKIYYFFYLNETLNSEVRSVDYYAWDKYSWFLNLGKQKEEALEANSKAEKALEEFLKRSSNDEAIQHGELIKKHKTLIEEEKWNTFP